MDCLTFPVSGLYFKYLVTRGKAKVRVPVCDHLGIDTVTISGSRVHPEKLTRIRLLVGILFFKNGT